MGTTTTYPVGNLTSTPSHYSTFLNDTFTDDVYTFHIDGTQSINLDLHGITAEKDADLTLYRDLGTIGTFNSGVDQYLTSSTLGVNRDDSINYQASAGDYIAVVHRYQYSSGSLNYQLDLSATPTYPSSTTAPNLLPNEDGATLSRGSYHYYGAVGDNNTSQVYRFSLASDPTQSGYGFFNFTLTGLTADADIRVISDLNNNQIVDPGEVSQGLASTNGGNTDESLSVGVHTGIPFYLQVYQYSGNTNYQLNVDVSYF